MSRSRGLLYLLAVIGSTLTASAATAQLLHPQDGTVTITDDYVEVSFQWPIRGDDPWPADGGAPFVGFESGRTFEISVVIDPRDYAVPAPSGTDFFPWGEGYESNMPCKFRDVFNYTIPGSQRDVEDVIIEGCGLSGEQADVVRDFISPLSYSVLVAEQDATANFGVGTMCPEELRRGTRYFMRYHIRREAERRRAPETRVGYFWINIGSDFDALTYQIDARNGEPCVLCLDDLPFRPDGVISDCPYLVGIDLLNRGPNETIFNRGCTPTEEIEWVWCQLMPEVMMACRNAGTVCTDEDADGYSAQQQPVMFGSHVGDCLDSNANVYPGAPDEPCDCDGFRDCDGPDCIYIDACGSICAPGLCPEGQWCDGPSGLCRECSWGEPTGDQCSTPCTGLPSGDYCASNGPQGHEGDPDDLLNCLNGEDVRTTPCPNGCVHRPDGTENDYCRECPEGAEVDCYTGGANTEGVGVCRAGVHTCVNGLWSDICQGQITPTPEIACNGIDENCNGAIDEGFDCECAARDGEQCGSSIGECQLGRMRCFGGILRCEGAVGPEVEICDGLDNDCDGTIDNGVANACGGCGPEPVEVCNGQGDEDCDGSVDEQCGCVDGDSRPCGSDIGECQEGEQVCVRGAWGACEGNVQPVDEECDGLDNDCDTQIDEGAGVCAECQIGQERSCGSDVGECQQGEQACVGGVWGACEGDIEPADEECDDLDNDCDGQSDEGIECEVCADFEYCDGFDEDCDGVVDEDCRRAPACHRAPDGAYCGDDDALNSDIGADVWILCEGGRSVTSRNCLHGCDTRDGMEPLCRVCADGASQACSTDVGECVSATERCIDGRWAECLGGRGPSDEICDGLDNDCDGRVDEDAAACGACQVGLDRACGSFVGECQRGNQTCGLDGWGPCLGARGPQDEVCDGLDNDCDGGADEAPLDCGGCEASPEACDGVDNDCDGQADEQLSRPCQSACGAGDELCRNGRWAACNAPEPQDEHCDDVDNDCDGRTDENNVCGGGEPCDDFGTTRCVVREGRPDRDRCSNLFGGLQWVADSCDQGDTCCGNGTCYSEAPAFPPSPQEPAPGDVERLGANTTFQWRNNPDVYLAQVEMCLVHDDAPNECYLTIDEIAPRADRFSIILGLAGAWTWRIRGKTECPGAPWGNWSETHHFTIR